MTTVQNARSTVATVTELADHSILLRTSCGETWCSDCGTRVRKYTPEAITQTIVDSLGGKRVVVLAPIFFDAMNREEVLKQLMKGGFYRAWVDGAVAALKKVDPTGFTSLELGTTHTPAHERQPPHVHAEH